MNGKVLIIFIFMTADYANCFVLVDFAEIIISKSSAKYRDMKFYVEKQLEWSHTATTTTTAWNEMDLKLIQTESTLWFYRNEEKNHFLRQFTFRTSTMCSNWTPKWFMSHATWNIRQMKLSTHKKCLFEQKKKELPIHRSQLYSFECEKSDHIARHWREKTKLKTKHVAQFLICGWFQCTPI